MLIYPILALALLSDAAPEAAAEKPERALTHTSASITIAASSTANIRIGASDETVEVQGLILPASAISSPLVVSGADKTPAQQVPPQGTQIPAQSKPTLLKSGEHRPPGHQ